MDTNQFYDRKQYIEQVRSSFSNSGEKKHTSYMVEQDTGEKEVRSFFKLRFLLAIALFLGFIFIQKADISYESLNASNIVKQIKHTVVLPESLSNLKETIHIE